MELFNKHQSLLEKAIAANEHRTFFSAYPENPKAYDENANNEGLTAFQKALNTDYLELNQGQPLRFEGEEVSPYLQNGLGIGYPVFADKILVLNATQVADQWRKTNLETRAGILIESLEKVKSRFFEIAYATMHTTGQAFMMSFQASGPHAADRALEVVAMGYKELTRFPKNTVWDKPMGKFNITVKKTWQPVPKGIGLVIGCSTFPTWNTVPGLYASLITGNPVIVKPHPKAVLPIAIVVSEIQKTLQEQGLDPKIVQLAVDSSAFPLAKELAQHPDVKLIDYTGNSIFGNWLETLTLSGKEVFTEKAGVNSIIIDSTDNLKGMCDNIAFSLCLYSGQMCTTPQNIFIPKNGIATNEGHKSFEEIAQTLTESINAITQNPKMAAGVLGAIQNDQTLKRVKEAEALGLQILLHSSTFSNVEFEHARTATPTLMVADSQHLNTIQKEWFGPISVLVKTENTQESLKLASALASKHGAISCSAYSVTENVQEEIAYQMASSFTSVSFNLTGALYINQNAAFSDFHVTGGNPSGNASFTDPNYVNRRYVWIGQRYS